MKYNDYYIVLLYCKLLIENKLVKQVIVLLFYCAIVLLFYCVIVLLFYCVIVLLFYCVIVLLRD